MKSNKYLTIGLLTGFIVGGCIGVLAWAFLQNLFAISICAGIGMLIGIVILNILAAGAEIAIRIIKVSRSVITILW